ncbi:cytochrome P450 [Neolentinus lepideus HHB14362 ss-1]|uniref:Cytochrome P450 n=1 Tax=Neolentinus lepideus HHB14362 ss-1 TaxID=1314782 RepID=A0A165U1Y2_9AGAM|nr:cytochrome P450 [Neolentinus lepideus HHB14362 ss-1]
MITSLSHIVLSKASSLWRTLSSDYVLAVSLIVNLSIVLHVVSILLSKTGAQPFGYPHWLGPYYGGFRFFYAARSMSAEGYRKFKSGGVYKLPRWNSWLFVVTGEKLVSEIHNLPDDTLSMLDSAYEELQIKYTMGESIHFDPYHVAVLKNKLRRNLDELVAETTEEVILAFEDLIGKQCDDTWRELDVVQPLVKTMCRTFNRIIVGPTLCRNEEYLDLASKNALERFVTGLFINVFPLFVRPYAVGRLVTQLPRTVSAAMKYYVPLISARAAAISKYGKSWEDKPSDVLSWLMDTAKGPQQSSEDLTVRLLATNGASTHTSSMSFTQALINIAMHPEYVDMLRKEAQDNVDSFGLTKAALDQLGKMDSFLKESMRVNGLGSATHTRRACKTFALSDGTIVPEGSYVSAALDIHFDEAYYPNPESFDGLRFYKGSESSANNDDGFAVPNLHYLPWGYGKHAWAGRFLVSYVMKALMAHILLSYDVRMGGNGKRPRDVWWGYMCSHSRRIKMQIKRRKAAVALSE